MSLKHMKYNPLYRILEKLSILRTYTTSMYPEIVEKSIYTKMSPMSMPLLLKNSCLKKKFLSIISISLQVKLLIPWFAVCSQ